MSETSTVFMPADKNIERDQIEIPDIELTLDKWRSTQEGRELTNEVYPINVDQLFTLLFTNSKFYRDFHANRKTFGINMS